MNQEKQTLGSPENQIRVVIIFPYSGFNTDTNNFSGQELVNQENRKRNFEKIVKACSSFRPLVVINKDTVNRKSPKNADEFFQFYAQEEDKKKETFQAEISADLKNYSFDVYQVWSVDTCQMWLAGWGHLIDELERNSESLENYRVVQIPGDLDTVGNSEEFFEQKIKDLLAKILLIF
jgi:hypothetical protein